MPLQKFMARHLIVVVKKVDISVCSHATSLPTKVKHTQSKPKTAQNSRPRLGSSSTAFLKLYVKKYPCPA